MKYLVATDGSVNARACVHDLSRSQLAEDDRIKVVAVWNSDPLALIPPKLNNANAVALVNETVSALRLSFGDRVTGDCLRGDVVASILKAAQTWGADKILMGAHASSNLPEALISDNSKEILRKAKSSVVIYRHSTESFDRSGPKKVLWCIDSAAQANRVFVLLQNHIDLPSSSELRILHVLQSAELWERRAVPRDPSVDENALHRDRMQQLMDEQIQKIKDIRPDVIASTFMVEGSSPVSGILKYAGEWRADLIVTGAHTYTLGERILLGSASEELVSKAGCSVEVVR
jgi:nucleotide-binding universal stress UspA family protein